VSATTLHLLVQGRVQGVGFRWHIVDVARKRDLAGWVRNRDDGAVEIAASGSAEALALLEAAARQGPAGARITSVEKIEAAAFGELKRPFAIARD
jgi:acylphosphatase